MRQDEEGTSDRRARWAGGDIPRKPGGQVLLAEGPGRGWSPPAEEPSAITHWLLQLGALCGIVHGVVGSPEMIQNPCP